jgi:hypothetical protein
MNKTQLIEKALNVIKISRLRRELPDIKSKKKEDFVNELYRRDKQLLEYLINYYSLLKKRSVFFSYSNEKLDFKDIESKKIIDEENDLIFEFQKIISRNNQVIVNVKAHSQIYEYSNVEEPETLEPINVRFRKPFTLYFIYHSDTSIIECRTSNYNKFETVKNLIQKHFNLRDGSITLIQIKEEDYKKLDKNIRFKSVRATGLNIAGANEIHIKGSDVEKTLGFFENKGIKIKESASKLIFQKVDMNKKPITFYDNGKITFRPQIKDIYKELKEVLLKYVKEIK